MFFNQLSETKLETLLLMTSLIHLNQIIENLLPLLQWALHVLFNYNMYEIENKESKLKVIKNMKNYYCFTFDENKDPLYFIVEKQLFPSYFAYNQHCDSDYIILFCSESRLNLLLKDDYEKKYIPIEDKKDIDHDTGSNSISYFSFAGSIGHYYISERNINLSKIHSLNWYDYQENLYQNIMKFYKKNNYCKVFLSGDPGMGKTFFAYLMAQRLNCYLTDQYNPTDPGNSLSTLYHRAKKVSSSKPLIIVLDEMDVLLEKLQKKEITPHKHYKIEVCDKLSWNHLMDKVSFGLFPYVIILCISNKKKSDLDKIDSSYLRNGRIDINEVW
tara:strand:+ start:5724 stop:6710 length:987 start_codon:yes stop_codon:yes gene_type:complete